MPISSRSTASPDELGNGSGVAGGPPAWSAGSIASGQDQARLTRAWQGFAGLPRASAALLGPLFRAMAQLGALRWFMDHQHLINTLVTNVHGPDERLAFGTRRIRTVIPISIVTGNVTVAFAVLSYAKTLTITINSDADACPDLDRLTELFGKRGPRPDRDVADIVVDAGLH